MNLLLGGALLDRVRVQEFCRYGIMKHLPPLFVVLLVLLTVPHRAVAQWVRTNGPCGRRVNCVVVAAVMLSDERKYHDQKK